MAQLPHHAPIVRPFHWSDIAVVKNSTRGELLRRRNSLTQRTNGADRRMVDESRDITPTKHDHPPLTAKKQALARIFDKSAATTHSASAAKFSFSLNDPSHTR